MNQNQNKFKFLFFYCFLKQMGNNTNTELTSLFLVPLSRSSVYSATNDRRKGNKIQKPFIFYFVYTLFFPIFSTSATLKCLIPFSFIHFSPPPVRLS